MTTSEATPLTLATAERNPTREFWRRLLHNRTALISLIALVLLILLAVLGPAVYTASPIKPDYAAINSAFSDKHPFGTDNLGRDTLARLLYGLRVSLIVAFYVEAINVILGVTLGLVAGYVGGLPDVIITRIADMLFAFPGLLLAILIAAVFGAPVTERFGGIGRLLLVAGAISLVSWPLMARLVRSQTLVLKEQEFVMAARSLGARDWQIVTQHILPNLIGQVIVAVTLDIGGVVVSESVLSLLGLGIQPPDPSIGKMISDAIPYLEGNALQVIVPSLTLMLIVMCASFLGDGLRDAFDPSTR